MANVSKEGRVLYTRGIAEGLQFDNPQTGMYCLKGEAIDFNPRSGQVTAMVFPGGTNPAVIATIFVAGKSDSFGYAPCGRAVDYPVWVSIYDTSTHQSINQDFSIWLSG